MVAVICFNFCIFAITKVFFIFLFFEVAITKARAGIQIWIIAWVFSVIPLGYYLIVLVIWHYKKKIWVTTFTRCNLFSSISGFTASFWSHRKELFGKPVEEIHEGCRNRAIRANGIFTWVIWFFYEAFETHAKSKMYVPVEGRLNWTSFLAFGEKEKLECLSLAC